MKHFTIKSLTFYGVAITAVVGIFAAIASYGESQVKAPPKIAGRYKLDAKKLPGCLKSETLILTIEQSGIYISGSLLTGEDATQNATEAKKKPSLSGLWDQQKLELSGEPSHLPNCMARKPLPTVTLQGTIVQGAIRGAIVTSETPLTVTFVAQPETEQAAQQQTR